jgi:hypothetical protein
MLRTFVFDPISSSMDGPRLCRSLKVQRSGYKYERELKKRISEEPDPAMLHDYLLAMPEFVDLPKELPFRLTLLAASTVENLGLVNFFLSEFCKIDEASNPDLLLAGAKGLELVSHRNPDAVPTVFPHVLKLIKRVSRRVRNHLFNAISNSVGNGKLEAEFVWKAFHNIRTVPSSGLGFDDLVHYAIIALNDEENSSVAVDLINQLIKKDRLAVVSGLWRCPADKARDWLPNTVPNCVVKNDTFKEVVLAELEKNVTTQARLMLASAFSMFFDVFKDVKEPWIEILTQAGEAVFEMKVEPKFVELLLQNFGCVAANVRFACGFALALLLSYRLVESSPELVDRLIYLGRYDEHSSVRLICYYGASLCDPVDDCDGLINELLTYTKGKRGVIDDLMGIGYLIYHWFPYMLSVFDQSSIRNRWLSFEGTWAFTASLCDFPGVHWDEMISGDKLGIAQHVHLQKTDFEINVFVSSNNLDDEMKVVAAFGYIPEFAFRVHEFLPPENVRRLVDLVPKDHLMRRICSRERKFHRPQEVKIATSKPTMQTIRQDFAILDDDLLTTLLSGLSHSQKNELMGEVESDSSIVVAMNLRDASAIAKILADHRRSVEMMSRIKTLFPDATVLIREMFACDAKPERIAEVLVFYRLGEFLCEENCLLMLPVLLAEIEITDEIVEKIKEAQPAWIREFAVSLLLRQPTFFQFREETFELFD